MFFASCVPSPKIGLVHRRRRRSQHAKRQSDRGDNKVFAFPNSPCHTRPWVHACNTMAVIATACKPTLAAFVLPRPCFLLFTEEEERAELWEEQRRRIYALNAIMTQAESQVFAAFSQQCLQAQEKDNHCSEEEGDEKEDEKKGEEDEDQEDEDDEED